MNLARVASRDEVAEVFKTLGINTDGVVVIYDDNHHMFSGRIWWSMRYWGFNNVCVLDGGWPHWSRQGLPVSDEVPTFEPGNFTPTEQPALRIDFDEFVAQRATSCVIDARGVEGYRGSSNDPRSGHIPDAVNMPWSELLNAETGLFKEPDAISTVLDQHVPEWRLKSVIPSCGSGYAATVLMLAFELVGVHTALFDDSFAIWKQDKTRPVQQGPEPS